MYYNTTNEQNPELKEYRSKTKSQDKIVLSIANRFNTFSASKILEWYPTTKIPITSIRRSLNTLEKDNKIVKTGNKVIGIYGRNENEYKIL